MITLDFIRHAESVDGAAGLVQRDDSPLTKRGIESCLLARRGPQWIYQARYSSPAARALQTLNELWMSRSFVADERLREIGMGAAIGRRADDVPDGCPEGGEPWSAVGARVGAFMVDALAHASDADRILVVTHRAVIRLALSYALGLETDRGWARRFQLDHLGLTRLQVSREAWRVVCVNASITGWAP